MSRLLTIPAMLPVFVLSALLCAALATPVIIAQDASEDTAPEADNQGDADETSEESTEDTAEQAIADSKELLDFGETVLAKRRLLAAERKWPENTAVKHALAEIFLNTKLADQQQAKNRYRRILALDQSDANAHYAMASLLWTESFSTRGASREDMADLLRTMRNHLKLALDINPEHRAALIAWAQTYQFEHHFLGDGAEASELRRAKARRLYERAVSLGPGEETAEAYTTALEALSILLIDAGEGEEALKQLALLESQVGAADHVLTFQAEAALVCDPPRLLERLEVLKQMLDTTSGEDTPTELRISLVRRALDAIEGAAEDKKPALRQQSAEWLRTLEVALDASARWKPDERLGIVRAWTPDRGENMDHKPILPELCYLAGEAWFTRAQSTLRQVVAGGDEAQRAKAVREAQKLMDAALRNLDECDGLATTVSDVLRLRANLELWLGNFEAARERFVQLAEQVPGDLRAAMYRDHIDAFAKGEVTPLVFEQYLSVTIEERMNKERRIAMLRQIVGGVPDFADARVILGRLLEEQGDFANALQHFESVLENYPDHPRARLGVASCSTRLGDIDRAFEVLSELVKERPQDDEVQRTFAMLKRVEDGSLSKEALLNYQRSLSQHLRPADKLTYLNIALTSTSDFYEAHLELVPLLISLAGDATSTAERDGLLQRALESSKKMLALADSSRRTLHANYNLAQSLLELGEVSEAADAFQAAHEAGAELPRDDWNEKLMGYLYYAEARLRFNQGSHARSNLAMESAIKADLRPDALRPDGDPYERLKAEGWSLPLSEDAFPLNVMPKLIDGQILDFAVDLQVLVEDDREARVLYGFDVQLEVNATPEVSGAWELDLRVMLRPNQPENIQVPLALQQGLEGSFIISPWFGLAERVWSEEPASLETANLLSFALVEMLAIGRGTQPHEYPLWGLALDSMSIMRLQESTSCVLLDRYSPKDIVMRRLEIADYIRYDEGPQGMNSYPEEYEPRQRIDSEVVLEGQATGNPRQPRAIRLNKVSHELKADQSGMRSRSIGIALVKR